jgi:hypothetical protein
VIVAGDLVHEVLEAWLPPKERKPRALVSELT